MQDITIFYTNMLKRLLSLLTAALLTVNFYAQPITAGEHTRVNTVYGTIEGYQDGNIFTFKGIQYAKAERFMPPEAPDKFTQLRQCKLYGPQAPQGESLHLAGFHQDWQSQCEGASEVGAIQCSDRGHDGA